MLIKSIILTVCVVTVVLIIFAFVYYLEEKVKRNDDKTAEAIYTALISGESYLDYIGDLSTDRLRYMIKIHSPSPIYEYRRLAFTLVEELERRSI